MNFFLFVKVIESKFFSFNLYKMIEAENLYQITYFISNNFTNISGQKMLLFSEFPSVTYIFDADAQYLQDYYLKNSLKNMYSLQESLVIFMTSILDEVDVFIDYLMQQLTVRKTPKVLIIFSSNLFKLTNEVNVIKVLKYSWENKFLDFSIIVINLEITTIDSLGWIYYNNPFNDIIYRRKLNETTQLFPDKLSDAKNYTIYTTNYPLSPLLIFTKKSNRKTKIETHPFFVIGSVSKILNLNIAIKNSNYSFGSRASDDFLQTWDLDVFPILMYDLNYLTCFLIPADDSPENIVAFVPIIPTSRIDIIFKILYYILVAFGIIFLFSYIFHYFQALFGNIKVFDLVNVFLNQPIKFDSQKAVDIIIIGTVITVSFITMNDILSGIISVSFEKREMSFESFEDLYKSELQTYTDLPFLTELFENKPVDPYLVKILNRTLPLSTDEEELCFNTMKVWKNISCISFRYNSEYFISSYRNLDGSSAIKVSQPPILTLGNSRFYWFAPNSPYAMKFLETMRIINEGSLMHWEALVFKGSEISNIEENKMTNDKIKSEQLMIIISAGISISVLVFIMELTTFRIRKNRYYD